MAIDPITLEVFNHRFSAIAEEMGTALRRSAFSPNIKERQDYSCALFTADGSMAAQAAHIPVHLGSAPLSVQAAMAAVEMREGDVVVLNDPFAGGTHLPDVTVVAPIFASGGPRPVAFVANRAHHADIGGGAPGSMGLATEIYQEGLRLPPVRLVRGGELDSDILRLFLANTRVEDERRGDLMAQLAALRIGQTRIAEQFATHGVSLTLKAMVALQDYSERLMRAAIRRLQPGTYRGVDWLDDDGISDGPVELRVAITLRTDGSAAVDFRGSAAQVPGSINANYAVTIAAILYTFQLVAGDEIPANSGLARPIAVEAPPGTIVNARFPAAVAAGNVETSQRIVDVLLKALAGACPDRIPAASNGSMNNLSIGGFDPKRGKTFAYYETIAGGCGAGPEGDGASGRHSHMTNTLNTPLEALERAYPMEVVRYGIRRGSGGRGKHRGGDGIVREIEMLATASVSLLAERRRIRPYGANGGEAGAPGSDWVTAKGRRRRIRGKVTLQLQPGDRIRIETPAGGGWGRPRRSKS